MLNLTDKLQQCKQKESQRKKNCWRITLFIFKRIKIKYTQLVELQYYMILSKKQTKSLNFLLFSTIFLFPLCSHIRCFLLLHFLVALSGNQCSDIAEYFITIAWSNDFLPETIGSVASKVGVHGPGCRTRCDHQRGNPRGWRDILYRPQWPWLDIFS